MPTNPNHILTAKQEKLISRLAILSSSRKESEDVSVNFFKNTRSYGTEVSMVSFNSSSAIFVTKSDSLFSFSGDGLIQFKASDFRASSAFNNLGLLNPQEDVDCLMANQLLDSSYFKQLDFYKIIASDNRVTQFVLDATYLPRRLHSVFVSGKYHLVSSKAIVLATKVIGLEVFYISEIRSYLDSGLINQSTH
jgi:hypothetical protein